MPLLLHRTEDRRRIAQIPAGSYVWDDLNDVPAQFHGWSERNGCYELDWLNGLGGFYKWDLDGAGQPSVFEVLRAEEVQE
jgi:hypothetical protein